VAIYTAVHVGADAVRGDIDSWRDLGVSAGEGAFNGTLAALTGGTSEAVTAGQVAGSAISSELPSVNVPVGPAASISLSPNFAYGSEGLTFGADVSVSQRTGGVVLGITGGYSRTSGSFANSLNGGHGKVGWFGGVAGKNSSLLFFSNRHFASDDPDFNQTLKGFSFTSGGWSGTWSNDWDPISKTGTDQGRTASVEIGHGSARLGFNVYTSAPERTILPDEGAWNETNWGTNDHGSYTGKPYASALYFGYVKGRNMYRAGVNSPYVQDFFQNGLHKYIGGVPYFPRGNYRSSIYGYYGKYNPFIY
jgi:hypothetical protein